MSKSFRINDVVVREIQLEDAKKEKLKELTVTISAYLVVGAMFLGMFIQLTN